MAVHYVCVHMPKKIYFDEEEIRVCLINADNMRDAKMQAKAIVLNSWLQGRYYPPRVYFLPIGDHPLWLRKPA
jgi:hypothetical protein